MLHLTDYVGQEGLGDVEGENMDPNARVLTMSQKNFPFENEVVGVCSRENLSEPNKSWDKDFLGRPTFGTDVFIIEGDQLKYGDKATWGNRY